MNWAALFERGAEHETDVKSIREALAARRERRDGEDRDAESAEASDGE